MAGSLIENHEERMLNPAQVRQLQVLEERLAVPGVEETRETLGALLAAEFREIGSSGRFPRGLGARCDSCGRSAAAHARGVHRGRRRRWCSARHVRIEERRRAWLEGAVVAQFAVGAAGEPLAAVVPPGHALGV